MMKIAVCLKEVIDSRLDSGYGYVSDELFLKGLPRCINPPDTNALSQALSCRKTLTSVEIIAVAIGPESVEEYLREALAIGADRAVRIWQEDFNNLSAYHKAKIITKFVSLEKVDLVLVGSISLDNASGSMGAYISAMSGFTYSGDTVSFALKEADHITAIQAAGRGWRNRVKMQLPAVLGITGEGSLLPYPSLDTLIENYQKPVYCYSLADLGMSMEEIKTGLTRVTACLPPAPRPRKVITPESTMPAFYRILKLIEGGMAKRQGKMLSGTTAEQVEQIYQFLIDENILTRV